MFLGVKEHLIFVKRYFRQADRCTIFKFTLKFPRENESLNFASPLCGWGCNKNNLDTPIDSFNWEVIKSGIKSDWKTFFALFPFPEFVLQVIYCLYLKTKTVFFWTMLKRRAAKTLKMKIGNER